MTHIGKRWGLTAALIPLPMIATPAHAEVAGLPLDLTRHPIGYTALIKRVVQLGLDYMPEWRMFET